MIEKNWKTEMTQEEFDNHPAWKDADFEGAERTMLLNGMRMTLAEKLRWLEEAETFDCNFPSTGVGPSPRGDSRQKADSFEFWISKFQIRNHRNPFDVRPAAANMAKISLASCKSLATSLRSPIPASVINSSQ